MDVCETMAQLAEPPLRPGERDLRQPKDGDYGERGYGTQQAPALCSSAPASRAAWLEWRDGATFYQAFARMSECMSGLHFDQIEGHFALPLRPEKREIFQCFV